MAKKGAGAGSKRNAARGVATPDGMSDSSSLTGEGGRGRNDSDGEAEALDPWDAAWDQIMDGNSSMRAQGIAKVCALLRGSWAPEVAHDSQGKCMDVASSALLSRRADKREQEAAAWMLALLFISLGRDFDGFFGDVQAALRHACQEGKAKGAAVAAFAIGAFCCTGTDEDDLAAVRFLAGLWLTSTGEALVAALRGWSLVISDMDVRVLSVPLIQASLGALSNLLGGKEVAVRNAAAAALAVLYSQCGLEVVPEGEEGDDEASLEGGDASEGAATASLSGSSCAVSSSAREVLEAGFEAIVMRMNELSKNRGDKAKLNKHDKKASKAAASAALAALNGEAGKREAFKLKSGERVEFETLASRVQRDALRDALRDGFQIHMNCNPLMQDVFGHGGTADAGGRGGASSAARWKVQESRAVSHKQRQSASRSQQARHMMEDW